jgi:hypothetical protein
VSADEAAALFNAPGVEALPPSAQRRAQELAAELRGLALRYDGARSVRMLERIVGDVGAASMHGAELLTTVRQALGTPEPAR